MPSSESVNPHRTCRDVGCMHGESRHGGDKDNPYYCFQCGGERGKHSFIFPQAVAPKDNGGLRVASRSTTRR